MRRFCQGYCGGAVSLENIHRVGPSGEAFCPECYGEWLRWQYYGD
ncbi:hypothetical protein [Halopiger xanaduensis]|nr:hypothetical protein [Halopiger xanaduensis]